MLKPAVKKTLLFISAVFLISSGAMSQVGRVGDKVYTDSLKETETTTEKDRTTKSDKRLSAGAIDTIYSELSKQCMELAQEMDRLVTHVAEMDALTDQTQLRNEIAEHETHLDNVRTKFTLHHQQLVRLASIRPRLDAEVRSDIDADIQTPEGDLTVESTVEREGVRRTGTEPVEDSDEANADTQERIGGNTPNNARADLGEEKPKKFATLQILTDDFNGLAQRFDRIDRHFDSLVNITDHATVKGELDRHEQMLVSLKEDVSDHAESCGYGMVDISNKSEMKNEQSGAKKTTIKKTGTKSTYKTSGKSGGK